MKNIIQFSILEEDGVYTAEGVNVPIVTSGANFEDLKTNIQEAVELFFEEEDPISMGFGKNPSIFTTFELLTNNGVKT